MENIQFFKNYYRAEERWNKQIHNAFYFLLFLFIIELLIFSGFILNFQNKHEIIQLTFISISLYAIVDIFVRLARWVKKESRGYCVPRVAEKHMADIGKLDKMEAKKHMNKYILKHYVDITDIILKVNIRKQTLNGEIRERLVYFLGGLIFYLFVFAYIGG